MSRSLGAAGEALIKSFEKLALVGYADQGGIPTAGWGHTGPDVALGATYTQEQADTWFAADTAHAVSAVDAATPPGLTQNQFDALVSFAYNVGCGAFRCSTLLMYVRLGNMAAAACQFPKWVYVNGQVSAGLERRRAAEAALFSAT
jgi:lysozyme